jgi:hypothetical protein
MAFGLSSIFGGGPNVGAAKNLLNQSNQAGATYGSNATAEGAQLNPFFNQELKATHGYTPGQENELLTAANAGAGAATGAEQSALVNNAARTGNATGVGKSLDEMARDRSKAAAGASEGIAAQDVMGAKQENQAGAAGMQGLYGTNVNAQLGAMKQSAANLTGLEQAQTQAPSWLQGLNNVTKGIGDVGSAVTSAGGLPGIGNYIP